MIFSFGTRDVIYKNRIKTPPIITRNKIYANHGEFDVNRMLIDIIIEVIISEIPIGRGCFKKTIRNAIKENMNDMKIF